MMTMTTPAMTTRVLSKTAVVRCGRGRAARVAMTTRIDATRRRATVAAAVVEPRRRRRAGLVPTMRAAAAATSSYWSEEAMESETTVTTTEAVTTATMSASFDDEDEEGEAGSSGGGKRAIVLACVGAAVAAFAYSDVSATFPLLAPAQTLARSVVDLVAAGVDYFVDLVLDAYDAAILGCINVFSFLQSVLLTPASSGTKAAAAESFIANPSGMYSKFLGMLCAKPFMSIAAVLLTLSRVLASWTFAAAEYACALLYAMPLYVAMPTAVVGYLYYKKRAAKVAEEAKLKDKTKMSKAKVKAKEIIASGESSSTSAKWAARLAGEDVTAAKTMAMETNTVVELNAPSMESGFDFTSEFSSSSSAGGSYGAYGSDYTITPTAVDYDSYSSTSYKSSSSSYGSGALGTTGLYDFEESYSNRDAYMGGYNVDQAEIERIYAELMPKDAGIPLPVVTKEEIADGAKTTTVVEKEEVKSEKEETKVETKPEPVKAAKSEPVVETKPEPVKAAKSEPVVETKPEPVTTSAPKPVEKKPEPVKAVAKPPPAPSAPKVETKATTKKGGSKEAFYGFINKVSSIKTDDVAKVVTETAKSVASKENLEKAASLAKDAASKVQSTIDASQKASSPTLPQGTRKVSDGTNDDDLSEGTVIKKKK